jgi:phage/plasmid-associated DNA primase
MELACKPVLDHILRVWCKGDVVSAEWVLDWMAHLVQFPWIRMCSAIVLRGSPGAGKGCIVELLARVIGMQYYYQVKDAKSSIFSRFTPSGWEKVLLLFLDECSWGGSFSEAGAIKKMISENMKDVENKFGARFSINNYMNCIMASNEKWIVPAGVTSRRFLCLDLDNSYAGPKTSPYFEPVLAVPTEAFANFLHNRDVSKFNSREVPVTDLLREQKSLKFDSVTAWWDSCLKEEQIGEEPWGDWIANDNLFDAFVEYCKPLTHAKVCPKAELLRQLRTICVFPNAKAVRRTLNGPGGTKRVYATDLLTMEQARDQFCQVLADPEWFA